MTSSDLDGAARAVREGDDDTALVKLLAAWSTYRAPELADLIAEVSRRATQPVLPGKPRTKAQAAWIELERHARPSETPALLASLVELLATGPSHLAVIRLDALLARAPDPRIAEALITALGGPIGGWSDKVYLRFVKLVSLHGDTRLAVRLETAVAARAANYMDAGDLQRLAKLPLAWAAHETAPAPDGIATVRAALAGEQPTARPAKRPAPHTDGAVLLAAIYADPSADDARQVYADHLQTASDPRGELIALQLARAAGRGTPATLAREARLLKAHRTAWLGPIAADVVIATVVWERGFPIAATTKIAKANAAEASFTRVEWATFERLEFGSASLVTPAMRALVEVRGLKVPAARKLGKTADLPPGLRSIGLEIEYTEAPLLEPAVVTLLALPTLRALAIDMRWVGVTAKTVAELCAVAGARLEELTLTGITLGDGALFVTALAAPPGALQTLRWGPNPNVMAIARRTKDRWTTIELSSPAARALVGGLPADQFAIAG